MRSLWRCRNSGWFLLSRKRDGWDVIDLETWICLFGDVLRICFFLQGWLCSLRGETRQEFAGGNQIVRIVSDKNTHQESKLKKMNVLCIFCLPNFQFPSTSTCNVFKHLSLMQFLQKHFRSILFFLLKADLMQTGVLEWPEFLSLMSQSGRLRYFQMVHVSNIWLEIMVNV